MLTEQIKEIIEILPGGQLQIKKITEIHKDGVPIANNIHREVIEPDGILRDNLVQAVENVKADNVAKKAAQIEEKNKEGVK